MARSYSDAGVRAPDEMPAFDSMLGLLKRTFTYPSRGRPVLDFGYYANVLDLGNNLGLAISTDGVGTKLLVAEEMGKYDTVGIDCIAMNVNDIVCVGAEPLALVDYIAVQTAGTSQMLELAKGLEEGARRSHVSIPGGEIAQVPDMLKGIREGEAFDLVGTCVGTVALDGIVDGGRIEAGDALVGFASSGLHSNGYTLARRVFREDAGWALDQHIEDFGRTLGEELLEPTMLYVDLATGLLASVDVRGLAHITGDGLLNLRRMKAEVGFDIETLPPAMPVFEALAREGGISPAEMYRVYNMGIGFCAIMPESEVERALEVGHTAGVDGWRLGTAVASNERLIRLRPLGLSGAKTFSESDH